MNKQWNKYPIRETVDVGDCAGKVDMAMPVKLFYGNDLETIPIEDWIGVFNMNRGNIATIASKNYQIIQHRNVLQILYDTLTRLNIQVQGRMDNFGNKIRADLIFVNDGMPIVDDQNGGIKLGIRVLNSYNKTTSFRLEMYGFRTICQNGMSFGGRMGIMESTIHYRNQEIAYADIAKKIELFIARVMNSRDVLQKYVNEMMEDSMEFESMVVVLEKMLKVDKHKTKVLALMQGAKTRWDLYNALTNYASHGEHLTPNLQQHFETLSQRVMYSTGARLYQEAMVAV
jgi:hypothetical protein